MKSEVSKLDNALSEYEKGNPIMNDGDLISAIEVIRDIELLKPGDECDFDLIEEATEELHLLHKKNLIIMKRKIADFSSHHFDELKKKAENQAKTKKRITVKWIIPVVAIVFVLFTVLAVFLGINRPWIISDNLGGISKPPEHDEDNPFYFPEKGKAEKISVIEYESSDFFSSIAELFHNSDVVMLGIVTEELPEMKNSDNNKVTVKVQANTVWRGDISKGDTIIVNEIGKRLGNGHDQSLYGEPLLRKGMRVVLFLSDNDKCSRTIVKGGLGKFFIDDGGNVYSCGFFIDSEDVPVPDNEKIITLDEFRAVLDALK